MYSLLKDILSLKNIMKSIKNELCCDLASSALADKWEEANEAKW